MKKGKRQIGLALALAALLGLTACGSSSDNAAGTYSSSYATDSATTKLASAATAAESYETAAEEDASVTSSETSDYYDSRKLIRTVDMTVETQSFDELLTNIQAQVEALGGYIENQYTYNGSSYYDGDYNNRSASVTARIPADDLDGFLDQVAEVGNVTSRSESVEDVTLTYVDLESRRDALETEQERLIELLGQAGTVEDIITIEDRLSEVRYELQSMESQIRTYDNQIDFSTVYLDIQEVGEYTPVEEETVWERLSNGFVDSLRDVGEGFTEFFIWFVVNLPHIIVWAAILAVVVLIVRVCRRKSRARREKKMTQRAAQVMPPQMQQTSDDKGNNHAADNNQQ